MVIATGFFDGVHRGHRLVVEQLVKAAKERDEQSLVVTFRPHPRNVLQSDARNLRLLTSLEEKKELLKGLGVDRIEVLPFTKAFSRLSTEAYLRDYLLGRFGGKAILIGYDNRMGSDLLTPDRIEPLARSLGLDVIRTKPVNADTSLAISSTKIRALLARGDVTAAAEMLGYAYTLHGVVVAGNQFGRTIGFPTANMQLYEPLKQLPGNGVYQVEAETIGLRLKGMCNIGIRPTVSDVKALTIETNLFDFDEDIYGLDLKVHFLRKIRDERKFATVEELKTQLEADREFCRSAEI
jgi:riboflavin kinase/FMN adenylyltransferase